MQGGSGADIELLVLLRQFVVLMDPDMVWTTKALWPDRLSVGFACVDAIEEPRAQAVADELGVELSPNARCVFGARMPYVVPVSMAQQLGLTWWQAMAAYTKRDDRCWSDRTASFSPTGESG